MDKIGDKFVLCGNKLGKWVVYCGNYDNVVCILVELLEGIMSIDSVSGVYVEGVLGGKLVSRDNPIPVNVIGGSVGGGGDSGGANISLPTDANGNVLMNLNAIGTDDSLGVDIKSSSAT